MPNESCDHLPAIYYRRPCIDFGVRRMCWPVGIVT
jgi:hypothetical protein